MAKKGLLLVISGPSGAGKGTIVHELLQREPGLHLSVSATTRSPRVGEENGVSYYFVSKPEFEHLVETDGMLEHATYCDNYYGTPIAPIKEMIAEGKNVILEIEVQGGMQVMNKMDNAVGIFVLPPSFKELKNRLVGRNTESMDKIEKRLLRAQEEINEIDHYDYILINDDLDDAVETFRAILIGETQRVSRNKKTIKEVCETC